MELILSKYWLIVAAAWFTGAGILHDIFILKQHKGAYSRDLLRLLMDGHVLLLSGVILFICYLMATKGIQYGAVISLIISIAMLVYCGMIFPFLKSFGTLFISLMALAVSIRLLLSNP